MNTPITDFDPAEIQAVFFDAGGTLIDMVETVGATYSRIAKDFDVHVDAASLDTAFRTVWPQMGPVFADEDPAKTGEQIEMNWWRQVVKRVFAEVEVDDFPDFETYFDRLFVHYGRGDAWRAAPRARDLLSRLDDLGIPRGIISNFDGRLHKILGELDLMSGFDPFIISTEARAAKPDRAIYQKALDAMPHPAPPETVLMVGDDKRCDGEGSAAMGMPCFIVEGSDSTLFHLMQKFRLREPKI